MSWHKIADSPDPLDHPWRYTRKELRDSLLFHGTSEPIKGEIGSGVNQLWVAFDPATAQNYIPQSGGQILLSFPWGCRDNDHVHPAFAFATIVRQMGYKPIIHKADHTGWPIEWSYEGKSPTYGDVKRWIEQDMGYKADEHGVYRLKVSTVGGQSVVQPATYKMPGNLYMLSGKDKLNIFDMTRGRTGDLTDPDYNRYDLFKMLKEKGYDGVKIKDFGQSQYWGNYEHESIILFPSGLAKLKKHKINAQNFDWSDQTGWQLDTPEFKRWHMEEVKKALEEGRNVPDKVLAQYPDLVIDRSLRKPLDPQKGASVKTWYRMAMEQEVFPFYEEEAKQKSPEAHHSRKNIETLENLFEEPFAKGFLGVKSILDKYGYDNRTVTFPSKDRVIVVSLGDEMFVIDDFNDPCPKEATQWVNDLRYDQALALYPEAEEAFNAEFWNAPYPLFHGTSSENVEKILRDGLEPRRESRGLTNRSVGPAIFLSENFDEATRYGNNIVEVDTISMATDGYTPFVSQEDSIIEQNIKEAVARNIGLREYQFAEIYDGTSPTTVVFYEAIPAKYLKLVNTKQSSARVGVRSVAQNERVSSGSRDYCLWTDL